jgi:hypothetical protein
MLSETELHPVEYGSFEGILPEGTYGAGEVKIYDKGKYKVLKYDKKDDVLVVHLKGQKIDDVFSIVPAFKGRQGLIIKVDKRKWLKNAINLIKNFIFKIALKRDWNKESLKKLSDKELTFDHALTHRGLNLLESGKKFGDWTIKELKELHNAILEEAKQRGFNWE